MKIIFTWKKQWNNLEPFSEVPSIPDTSIDIISSLLMDSGGLPYPDTVDWIDILINKLISCSTGKVTLEEWGRDSWAVRIDCNKVTIYSLYDEQFKKEVPLIQFKKIVLAWRDFIMSDPQPNKMVTFEL